MLDKQTKQLIKEYRKFTGTLQYKKNILQKRKNSLDKLLKI